MSTKKRERFTEEFKVAVVREVLSGQLSQEAARRKYSFSGTIQVLKWMKLYEKYGVCSLILARNPQLLMRNKDKKQKPLEQLELEARIKLLEQQLEDQSLLREMYDRMIDIAEKEYKIPIRKKPNTK
jgi:transposase